MSEVSEPENKGKAVSTSSAKSSTGSGVPGRGTGLVVGVMVALAVVAVALGWLLRPEPSTPASAVSGVLSSLQSGDVSGAYEKLCADTKAGTSLEAFEADVQAAYDELGGIEGFTVGEVFEFTAGANVEYELTTAKQGQSQRQMFVEREGQDWRVCGIRSGREVQ